MERYNNILRLVVKTLLVGLIAGLIVLLFVSVIGGHGWEKAAGGTVSIGGIIALMDRFMKYDTLTKATKNAKNLDPELVKDIINSLKTSNG